MSIKKLKVVAMLDAMGIYLHVGDWVAFANGMHGDILFGQVIRLCDKSMVIKKQRGKDIRRTSKQVVKISEEQLTMRYFSL